MDIKRKREILNIIKQLCDETGEAYPMQIAKASNGTISYSEALSAMNSLAEEGLIELEELAFSCTVEYFICGITDKGIGLINS